MGDDLQITVYTGRDKAEWDRFVKASKNGTFLFLSDYMFYHENRFANFPLIARRSGKILALLPGNRQGEIFYSHQGLSYGGLILSGETKMEDVLDCFNAINQFLCSQGIKKVIYKSIPHIYAKMPSMEDEYALFLLDAKVTSCGISSAIDTRNPQPFSTLRKRRVKKAAGEGFEIRKNPGYGDFWAILSDNLLKAHGVNPVHSLEEMVSLTRLFPENIHLYTVYRQNECLAGVVVYETDMVAHFQYISASQEGKNAGALDYLFHHLVQEEFAEKPYIDFGISVEKGGHVLNKGLVFQKQGFGARGIVYKHYEYDPSKKISP